MTPDVWDRVMGIARVQAKFYKERARVYAVANERGGWSYVIDCPSTCSCRSENGGDE